ncbi:MAG: hypothetical protein ABR517_10410 [Thermoanaerobaculia bacterium]
MPSTHTSLHVHVVFSAEHHRHRTFQEEYRAFLEEWNIPFDERYLW